MNGTVEGGSEQRKSARHPCYQNPAEPTAHPAQAPEKCYAYILNHAEGADTPILLARILNISRGGIGLHVSDHFPCGRILTIALRNGDAKHHRRARVVHGLEQQNGSWVLGLEFCQPLEDAVLKPFLAVTN